MEPILKAKGKKKPLREKRVAKVAKAKSGQLSLFTAKPKPKTPPKPKAKAAEKKKPVGSKATGLGFAKKIQDSGKPASGSRQDQYWKENKVKDYAKSFVDTNKSGRVKTTDPHTIREIYAFRGLEFGQWLTQEDKVNYLAALSASLEDMATIYGLPRTKIGFDNKLTMAIGARGAGKALAHFEPQGFAINLTRYKRKVETLTGSIKLSASNKDKFFENTGGSGSLAHEWGHALDYFLATTNGDGSTENWLSRGRSIDDGPDVGFIGKRNERGAMERLLYNLTNNPKTGKLQPWYQKLCDAHKKEKLQAYWIRRNEIFARSFEVYTWIMLTRKGIRNTFLAKRKYESAMYPPIKLVESQIKEFQAIINALKKSK